MTKLLTIAVLLVMLSLSSFAALEDGLLSYYKLEGNASDSLLVNHGGINGTLPTVAGKHLNALNFTAGGGFVNLTTSTFNHPMPSGTMAIWVKPTTTPIDGTTYGIFGLRGGRAELDMKDATVRFKIGNSTSTFDQYLSSVKPGAWSLITMVWNGTHHSDYVNGTLVGTLAAPAPDLVNTTSGAAIGSFSNGANKFPGIIDEAAVWNRSLSAAEVGTLYNGSFGNFYPYTIPDNEAPVITSVPSNATGTWPLPISADFDATDNIGVTGWAVNSTLFSISAGGVLSNATLLSAGVYMVRVNVTDAAGNSDSELWKATIGQTSSSVNLTLAGNSSHTDVVVNATYNATVEVFGEVIDGGTINITLDGESVYYGDSPGLLNVSVSSVGRHPVAVIFAGDTNRTGSSVSYDIVATNNVIEPGQLLTNVCPTTVSGSLALWLLEIISLILIGYALTFSISWFGVGGSLMMFPVAWTMYGCSPVGGAIVTFLGIVSFLYFTVVHQGW